MQFVLRYRVRPDRYKVHDLSIHTVTEGWTYTSTLLEFSLHLVPLYLYLGGVGPLRRCVLTLGHTHVGGRKRFKVFRSVNTFSNTKIYNHKFKNSVDVSFCSVIIRYTESPIGSRGCVEMSDRRYGDLHIVRLKEVRSYKKKPIHN